MDTLLISAVPAFESGNETEICNKLQEFTKENAGTFSFTDVQLETKKKFVGDVVHMLELTSSWECQLLCLEALKIFSRDKYNMLQLEQRDSINLLLKVAGLTDEPSTSDIQVIIEAQKCLNNLVFNNTKVQQICGENGCAEGILARAKHYTEETFSWDVKFYDLRLLFLLTALVPDLRSKVRSEMQGISVLTSLLETQVLCNIEDKENLGAGEAAERRDAITVPQATLGGEILKSFFNIVIHTKMDELEAEDESLWVRLGVAFRALLLSNSENEEKTEEYHSHTINMLTHTLPAACIQQLIPEPKGATGGSATYQGYSMDVMAAIVRFLERRIDRCLSKDCSKSYSLIEQLNPTISALCVLSRSNRFIRKYLKAEVLPQRDFTKLPEEGESMRAKLVRLMTNPSTEVKESAADLIFILCKENVQRMIKYTGYGNAAGMLARRGLLMGGQGNTDYSDDEESSDTEEYRNARINPITGREEEAKPDPMEGISDEQKEFYAKELADMITKMSNEGVITPMMVGRDGRLCSMEEAMQRAQITEEPTNNSDTEMD